MLLKITMTPDLRKEMTVYKIGMIAPSGPLNEEKWQKGLKFASQLGCETYFREDILAKDVITAGSKKRRLEELKDYFFHKETDYLWCARGGYGLTQIIPEISELLKAHPELSNKMFLGMSDATVLHLLWDNYLHTPSIYAPMLATSYFSELTSEAQKSFQFALEKNWNQSFEQFSFQVLNHKNRKTASISGPIMGGCLSLCTSSINTPAELDLNNRIFFFEEIAEPLYRIDIMIQHLHQAGKFKNCQGIIVGALAGCAKEFTHQESLEYIFRDIDLPVIFDFPVGHINNCFSLPLGVNVSINLINKSITVAED